MTSDDLPLQVQTGWPMIGMNSFASPALAEPPPWQPWKLYGVKLQKHSGLDGKSVISVGSQVPILMAIDGH
jgi:hypothetical protein